MLRREQVPEQISDLYPMPFFTSKAITKLRFVFARIQIFGTKGTNQALLASICKQGVQIYDLFAKCTCTDHVLTFGIQVQKQNFCANRPYSRSKGDARARESNRIVKRSFALAGHTNRSKQSLIRTFGTEDL